MTDLEITKALLTSAEQSARDGEPAILVDTTTVISLLKASIRLDSLTGERMLAKLEAYFADTIAADHDVDDYMAERVFELIRAVAAGEQEEPECDKRLNDLVQGALSAVLGEQTEGDDLSVSADSVQRDGGSGDFDCCAGREES